MSRLRPFRLLGLVLLSLVALSIGTRPALKGQQPSAAVATSFVGGAFGGNDKEDKPGIPTAYLPAPPMTVIEAKIRLKLQEKIPMNFPQETPLDDLLKHVREVTVDKVDFPDGLPIYVNPQGLQDADKTPASTIAINLKGIPLATSLKLALDQLDLAFWIHPDGLLVITNKESEDIPVGYEGTVLHQLSAIQREVSALRQELRLLRGLPVNSGMYSGPLQMPANSTPAGGMKGPGGMM